MAFIPPDAIWYLADIVLEFVIEDNPENVVHINTLLIRADTPEQAYEKALALGTDENHDYLNTDLKQVRVIFRGLRQLNVVTVALEDGAELWWSEDTGVSQDELLEWIAPKEELSVFAPRRPNFDGPNYMPLLMKQKFEEDGFDWEEVKKGE